MQQQLAKATEELNLARHKISELMMTIADQKIELKHEREISKIAQRYIPVERIPEYESAWPHGQADHAWTSPPAQGQPNLYFMHTIYN